MNDTDQIFLFDMDGTVADYDAGMLAGLRKLASPNDPEIDYYSGERLPDWYYARMDLIKKQAGFWLNLPVIEQNMKIVRAAQQMGYVIEGLTKGPRTTASAWSEKLLWVQRHVGSEIDLTVTMRKGRYYGKVLMDDYPEYMLDWLKHRPRGLGIMPVRKHNSGFSHPNVVLYDGSPSALAEVMDRLRKTYDRAPGQPA